MPLTLILEALCATPVSSPAAAAVAVLSAMRAEQFALLFPIELAEKDYRYALAIAGSAARSRSRDRSNERLCVDAATDPEHHRQQCIDHPRDTRSPVVQQTADQAWANPSNHSTKSSAEPPMMFLKHLGGVIRGMDYAGIGAHYLMSPMRIWRTMQARRDIERQRTWNNPMHHCTARGLVLTAILSCACALSPAVAAGLGATYGTREPASCTSTAAPDEGAPSAEQAAQYLKCTTEKENGQQLTLLEDVVVQVAAKGRPYNPGHESMPEIDTDQPIYAVRGSFVRYRCSKPDPDILQNVGKNCSSVDQPNAIGNCWKTTFGDWRCTMIDLDQYQMTASQAPPH